ncbi:MAG TPA: 2-oxoacid:acceptor oxidoreductase subunit alpha, partial [Myxococcota bacterium]|nr:2-oxoacid:acceptor oxidoreductase subunit alpha [Myxococcota bacterium]
VIAWPFPAKRIAELAANVRAVVVAELNLGQMVREVERAVAGRVPVRLIDHAGGTVHDPDQILAGILEAAR